DRKALPAPRSDAYASQDYEAPQGEVETALARIWAELLSRERVGRRDSFFALGGNSLSAMRMLSLLHRNGFELALADLFQQPTLATLAERVREIASPPARATTVPVRDGTGTPLFLCHDGYGDDLYMHVLARHLPQGLPVRGLPALSANGPQRIPKIAAAMLNAIREAQPHGPYRLAGWSFGGVLAYEIARQLRAYGESIEFLGLVDSSHPSRDWGDTSQGVGSPLQALQRLCGQTPEASTDDSEAAFAERFAQYRDSHVLPEQLQPLSAADAYSRCRSLQRYLDALRHYRPEPIDVAVRLFVAEQRAEAASPALGWERSVPAALLQVRKVPGNHRSMLQSPRIEVLARALTQALAPQSSDRSDEPMELPL
ncbi:MAG: thioesterase domain-containing protein, partial [Lysobacter sp.]